MAMRNVYVSRRYLRPVVVGLLLCGLSGFALGQALGHRSATPPTAPRVVHASGALGTATPAIAPTPTVSTPTTSTTTTVADSPALLFAAPAVAHPGASHHDDRSKRGQGGHHGAGGGPHGHQGGHGKGTHGGD